MMMMMIAMGILAAVRKGGDFRIPPLVVTAAKNEKDRKQLKMRNVTIWIACFGLLYLGLHVFIVDGNPYLKGSRHWTWVCDLYCSFDSPLFINFLSYCYCLRTKTNTR